MYRLYVLGSGWWWDTCSKCHENGAACVICIFFSVEITISTVKELGPIVSWVFVKQSGVIAVVISQAMYI